jgi:hypothetical protein
MYLVIRLVQYSWSERVRRLRRTYRPNLQGRRAAKRQASLDPVWVKINQARNQQNQVASKLGFSSTLKTETIYSSETPDFLLTTGLYNPEDLIFHSY